MISYLETKLYSPGVASFLLHTASITADFSLSQLIVKLECKLCQKFSRSEISSLRGRVKIYENINTVKYLLTFFWEEILKRYWWFGRNIFLLLFFRHDSIFSIWFPLNPSPNLYSFQFQGLDCSLPHLRTASSGSPNVNCFQTCSGATSPLSWIARNFSTKRSLSSFVSENRSIRSLSPNTFDFYTSMCLSSIWKIPCYIELVHYLLCREFS